MAKDSLAGLHQFVTGFQYFPFHVGIDVHKRSYHIALRRADGRTVSAAHSSFPIRRSTDPAQSQH